MKKNLIRIIVGIAIVIYAIFGTNFIDELEKNVASVKLAVKELNDEEEIESKNEQLKVYFLDVGQADSIYINLGDYNMLIDAGNNEDGPKLVTYLKSLGVEEFNYVVATHPHEDHIGGMDDIINNFKIDEFYMPDAITTTKTFEDVLDALNNKNMKYSTPTISSKFEMGDASFKVLYTDNNQNNLNDTSIVLKLTYGETSFLFMGDASSKVEKKLLTEDIKSDVLKLGHHGSSYSTSNEFLNKVNPSYAIISVGKNNIYNHPTKLTLDKLKNITVYRTDNDGTIIATSNKKDILFQKEKTDTNG